MVNFNDYEGIIRTYGPNNFENLSLRIVVPTVRPFIGVEDGKIVSRFPNFDLFTAQFPKATKFFEAKGYEIGTMNSSGHYDGLLGYIQRGEAESCFHPIPLDIERPPGKYSTPLYQSGFGSVKLISFPQKKISDLSSCFLEFNLDVAFLLLLFYFVVVFLVSKLTQEIRLSEAALLLYRVMFKEHNLAIKQAKARYFLFCVLIYFLLLNTIIEQNVNTNLVVSGSPDLYDTIDSIYEDKKILPHFLRGHYTLQWFKNHRNDPKLKDIYERTMNCEFCVNDERDYMYYIFNEVPEKERHYLDNHIAMADENAQVYLKKSSCDKNYSWLKNKGIVRASPLIYTHIFAILVFQVHEMLLKILNRKISYITESGLVNMALSNIRNNKFGYALSTHPDYYICRYNNEISNLNTYTNIRVENVWKFTLVFFVFDCFLLLFFVVFWIKQMVEWLKTRNKINVTSQVDYTSESVEID